MTGALVSSLLNGGSGSGGVSSKKTIIKSATLPTASEKTLGAMYIYAGEDTTNLKHGYIYEGRSIAANTKEVEFSTNTIACSGADFWALVKTIAPSNYTEIVKGEMVYKGSNTWLFVGRNTNDEQVTTYEQSTSTFETAGFTFTGTFNEGDTVPLECEINETSTIQYVWRRIDVQPSSSKGQVIAVDAELSPTSENPVQNKAIAKKLGVDWVKPSDWIDIRSGALENSIYFLVGHSEPVLSEGTYTVATYPKFAINAKVSTDTNTYDVYVDGVKVATTAHSTVTTIDWGALYTAGTIVGGHNTTHPSNLVTHVVRVTPSVSTDTLTHCTLSNITGQTVQGLFWTHYQLSNPIRMTAAFGFENSQRGKLMEALTAKNNKITYTVSSSTSASGLYGTFAGCSSLVQIPVLEAENTTYGTKAYYAFYQVPAKKVVIKNNKGTETLALINRSNIQELDIENGVVLQSEVNTAEDAHNAPNLKHLPAISSTQGTSLRVYGVPALTDTVIDDSSNASRSLFRFYGTSTSPTLGLKGLTVSNQAPFDGASPQINVSHTGLSRAALVNLFNSMPYNVGYEVVGSPTITNGVASGFSISDYVNLSSTLTSFDEIVLSFIPDTYSSGRNVLFKTGINDYRGAFQQVSDTQGQYFYTKTDNTAGNRYVPCTPGIVNIFKIQYISENSISCILSRQGYEDSTFDLTDVDISATFGGSIYLGRGTSAYNAWSGSIDINNTYIKVNGVPWFRGTAAMTKNCTIVGCTGTADLTADDKAIATGKGWELTVE